jgi:CRISPR/Cas system-associated endonuclease Cas1
MRGRDNLVMDLMEACRPRVDLYALQLFQTHLFRATDFHETRKGVTRMTVIHLSPASPRDGLP